MADIKRYNFIFYINLELNMCAYSSTANFSSSFSIYSLQYSAGT
nr:MAG TPA: hypothetical protein [Caudoviricetes sp.]